MDYNMDFNDINESVEIIDAYETEIRTVLNKQTAKWEPWTTHITLTLYQDYYTLDIKYDKIEYPIFLRLRSATSYSYQLKAVFSRLCGAAPFNLRLRTGYRPTIDIPDWLLEWMRESRSIGVAKDYLGAIDICLEDADAIRTLVALLAVDLSKKTDDTPYAVKFHPKRPNQISLYLETITKNNTRFAVLDGKVVEAKFCSSSILQLETSALLIAFQDDIMKMVKQYGLPGITRDMISRGPRKDDTCDIILSSISIILHWKATVKAIVDTHQDLFESKTKLLRRMLAKSLETGKRVNHAIVNLRDDDFNSIYTNHRKTLVNPLEQVRAIVTGVAEIYADYVADFMWELTAASESDDEAGTHSADEPSLTWQMVKAFIMPEVENQVTMTCGTCGLLSFPMSSIKYYENL
jgi:hypothetical protein